MEYKSTIKSRPYLYKETKKAAISNTIIKEKILNQYLINQYCNDECKIKLKPIKEDRNAFERLFNKDELLEDSNITLNYRYFYERIIDGEISIDELYINESNIKKARRIVQ